MVIVALVLIALLGKETFDLYKKERQARLKRAEAEAEYAEVLARGAFLDERLDLLATSEGQEAELRERFGVAKEGERVIILVDEEPTADISDTKGLGWWQKIKSVFGRQ